MEIETSAQFLISYCVLY